MDFLKKKHVHERDQYIDFEEENHVYTIDHPISKNKPYTSVTTWIHTLFAEFDANKIIASMKTKKSWPTSKYFGKTDKEILYEWDINRNNAASLGTKMHFNIECFYNKTHIVDESIEYNYFRTFETLRLQNPIEKTWIPFRTEWTVFDEDYLLAGSIDMIFEDPQGKLHIFDWKRCKKIQKSNPWQKYAIVDCIEGVPDTNYWHYALQLNLYKSILERKYDKEVVDLWIVCLHPENKNKSFIRIKIPILSDDMNKLFKYRKNQINDMMSK
jgi:ATP-dependent exoDNAse (exonuclease V) beta subunit